MNKISKILIYSVISLVCFQYFFSWLSYADDACERPPKWWLCKDYWEEYYPKDNCCVRCEVCTNASLQMQLYINFQVEMLWALRQYEAQQVSLSSPFVKWLFSMWTLRLWTNFKTAIINQLNSFSQSAVDAYRATVMSSIMLYKMTISMASKDSWWWIFVLFRGKPFVRDRNTLQDIDDSISDTMWDVWMAWLWSKPLNENVKTEIVEILKKYSEIWVDGALFSEAQLQWSIKYSDVLNWLYRLNLLFKTFLAVNTSTEFEDRVHEFDKQREKNESLFHIVLNPIFLTNLSDSYSCGAWSCNTDIIRFVKDIKQVWWIKESFEKSVEMIKTADKNLAEAWKKLAKSAKNTFDKDETTWLELTDQQKELLRTVYGIDASKLSQAQWIFLSDLFNGVPKKIVDAWLTFPDHFSNENQKNNKKQSWKNEKDTENNKKIEEMLKKDSWTDDEFAFAISYINSDNNHKNKRKLQRFLKKHGYLWQNKKIAGSVKAILSWSVIPVETPESVVNNLNNTINKILTQENMDDKKILLNYSNVSSTRYFVEIWAYIHDMVENIIWTKKSPNSIIRNVWEACEYQCSNKSSKWCYAK